MVSVKAAVCSVASRYTFLERPKVKEGTHETSESRQISISSGGCLKIKTTPVSPYN